MMREMGRIRAALRRVGRQRVMMQRHGGEFKHAFARAVLIMVNGRAK